MILGIVNIYAFVGDDVLLYMLITEYGFEVMKLQFFNPRTEYYIDQAARGKHKTFPQSMI